MARKCKYRHYVSDAVDGELSEEMKARIMAHMELCEECRRLYKRFAHLDQEIAALPEIDPPPDFQLRLWQAIDGKGRKGFMHRFNGFFSGWRPALTAAALVFIFVIATIVLHGRQIAYKNVSEIVPANDFAVAQHLDLFEDYDIINNLPMLEHFDEISAMDGHS